MKEMTAKESNADQLKKVGIMTANSKIFPLAHAKAMEQEKEDNKEKDKEAAAKGLKLSFYEKYNAYDAAFNAMEEAAKAGKKTGTEFDGLVKAINDSDETASKTDKTQNSGIVKLEITTSRKRSVTYHGQGCQYDKEEIFASSKIERLMSGDETADAVDAQTEQTLKYMQKTLKAILDAEEKALPQKQVRGGA